jgi:zinc protease
MALSPYARPLLAALLLAGPLPAAAQELASRAIPLDPAVRAGSLPNGLRYYIRRNSRPEKRLELRLVVNAGSILEDDDQRGVAHFVEHMLFNGTRRFQKNDLVAYLESIGVRFGADLNAYTSFDETVYILPIPTDKPGLVERGLEILEDWASGALFEPGEVQAERGVVLEEWRSGLGAVARIRNRQWPVLFRGSRYADRLPIGDTATIARATPALLRRFYTDWYRPDLMALVAVGDCEPQQLEEMIRERFGGLRAPSNPRTRTYYTVPGHDSTLVTLVTDPEQQVTTVQVLYKRPRAEVRSLPDYRALLARRLYNRMFNDRLAEISRQPGAPFAFASSTYGPFVRTLDAYFLAAVVPDSGVARGLHALLIEARRVDQHGFLSAELERARSAVLRELESAFAEREKTESALLADEYIAHFLSGEVAPGIEWEYQAAEALLPEITLQEVNSLGQEWISQANRVLAIAAPQHAAALLPEPARLLDLLAASDSASVAPYSENVSTAALVPLPPLPGHIVAEDSLPELGVLDWRLANGARVLVKPTDFKADQVLLRAYSPGGLSLVADSDYVSAALATAIMERSGAGAFSVTDLQKRLAGKRVAISASIDEVAERWLGQASPKDLETMLQLMYLRWTAPRRDSAAFRVLLDQLALVLANRANSPEAVFADTVQVVMTQHHFRGRPIGTAMLGEVRLDRAEAIYRERFAGASDFTFVIVGAVRPDSLRPLVERWIGGLPAIPRREVWRDNGIRPPEGIVERVVRKGVEPKAQSLLLFTGETEFSPEVRYALRSLSDLLEIKLLDNLREALGGTYSVSATAQVSRAPRSEYQLAIQFESAPENATPLFEVVLAVIDSLQRSGPSQADVEKVRAQQLRELAVSTKENSYWALNLLARLENGEDPRGLLAYLDLVRNLTPESIRAAAMRYLRRDRYARFLLLPEVSRDKQ